MKIVDPKVETPCVSSGLASMPTIFTTWPDGAHGDSAGKNCLRCGKPILHRQATAKWCSIKCGKAVYNAANRAKRAAKYIANREKVTIQCAAWYAANRHKRAEWTAKNRDRITKRRALYHAENREKLAEKAAARRAISKDKIAARGVAYRASNPAKVAASKRIRRAQKLKATIAGATELKAVRQWEARVRKSKTISCYWCNAQIDPKKRSSWHLDHVIALAIGGEHSAKNLCVSCRNCNLMKKAKPLNAWVIKLPQPLLAF